MQAVQPQTQEQQHHFNQPGHPHPNREAYQGHNQQQEASPQPETDNKFEHDSELQANNSNMVEQIINDLERAETEEAKFERPNLNIESPEPAGAVKFDSAEKNKTHATSTTLASLQTSENRRGQEKESCG